MSPEEYAESMRALAKDLDMLFNGNEQPRQTGFVLLTFPFGVAAGARCNFISNGADRRDIAALFKEMANRFDGFPEVVGHA